MEKIFNYIDGKMTAPSGRSYVDNINPAEGIAYSLTPDSSSTDIDDAVQSATRAFKMWSSMPARERSLFMTKIADKIDERLEEFARAESIDNGKPISLARVVDIPRASANMRFYAGAALHFSSDAHITDRDAVNYTEHSPLGVVGCISPWNLPLYLFTWKIAPALAAGCTVVAKPSELTPMTAFLFSQVCREVHLPHGVLNVVHGVGAKAGQPIVDHPDVKAISFTGGTATGRKIATSAAPHFKKLSLELGGKNPNIVFADCDLEAALATSIQSSFSNQGEICLCGSRIFVERKIYDTFVDGFVKRTRELTIGDPLKETTKIGALVSEAHLSKVSGYIKLAQEEGGTILTGGERVVLPGKLEKGYYLQPTVIAGLNETCRTNQEEIFGPVVTIQPFDTEEEVVSWANCTTYGLSATVWTENLKKAHRVSSALKAGIVWVNCWLFRDLRTPFGGVKQSGLGREGGWDALRFFTDTKNICIRL